MQVKSVNKQVMYKPLRLQKRGTMHRRSLHVASADVATTYIGACATLNYCDEAQSLPAQGMEPFPKSGNGHVDTCALVC